MARGYQLDFSTMMPSMFDAYGRVRKAETMLAVISDYLKRGLSDLTVLDVGSSSGIIDNFLAKHFKQVVGVDIDEKAVAFARQHFHPENLQFRQEDAMSLTFEDNSFDIVICAQIYEHVPDAYKMMDEILRVLKPDGICYFSASNRFMLMEPHYNLPFLSILPKQLADIYVRMAGKASHYHEKHFSHWGLKHLVKSFKIVDYTRKIIENPEKFHADYMLKRGTLKWRIARIINSRFYWASPYIWILQKPSKK